MMFLNILIIFYLVMMMIFCFLGVREYFNYRLRKQAMKEIEELPNIPNGYVTCNVLLKPLLSFDNGKISYTQDVDRMFYPEYYIDGQEWPVDPVTKEKLPVVPMNYHSELIKKKMKEIKTRKKTTA